MKRYIAIGILGLALIVGVGLFLTDRGGLTVRGIQGDMSLAAGENHIGEVSGNLTKKTATFIRPTDTITYTIGDLIGTITTTATLPVTVTGACRVSGGSGYIEAIGLDTNKKSVTPLITVTLFNANNATLAADNAAYKSWYTDTEKVIATYALAALATPADSTNSDMSRIYDSSMRIPFVCASGQTSIWYVLVTESAFVPASGQSFTLSLWIDNN